MWRIIRTSIKVGMWTLIEVSACCTQMHRYVYSCCRSPARDESCCFLLLWLLLVHGSRSNHSSNSNSNNDKLPAILQWYAATATSTTARTKTVIAAELIPSKVGFLQFWKGMEEILGVWLPETLSNPHIVSRKRCCCCCCCCCCCSGCCSCFVTN